MFMLVIISMIINAVIINAYQLKVGVLAVENMDLVDKYFSKPWTKLFAVAIGISLAHFYTKILEYRVLKIDDIEKKLQHPFLFKMHKSRLINEILFYLGVSIITFDLFIGHPAIADPYCWTNIQNMLYFSLCRCSFTIGIALTLIPVFCGHKSIY